VAGSAEIGGDLRNDRLAMPTVSHRGRLVQIMARSTGSLRRRYRRKGSNSADRRYPLTPEM